jgi:hypothetical protein
LLQGRKGCLPVELRLSWVLDALVSVAARGL